MSSGFEYTYVTNDDMFAGEKLLAQRAIAFDKKSVIKREENFQNLKTISIKYLLPGRVPHKIIS